MWKGPMPGWEPVASPCAMPETCCFSAVAGIALAGKAAGRRCGALPPVISRSCPEGYAWANQDCMTLDGLPYVGLFSPHTPDLYVATGFGAWGMTNSMAAATLLADLVQGKKSPYASVYTPSRSMLRPQLLSNLGHTVSNFLRLTPKRSSTWAVPSSGTRRSTAGTVPATGPGLRADGSVLDGPGSEPCGSELRGRTVFPICSGSTIPGGATGP